VIASSCIPLASTLEETLKSTPILAGFPPAVSAAAGCVGIQNTAIIIRALGLRLIQPSWRVLLFCNVVATLYSSLESVGIRLVYIRLCGTQLHCCNRRRPRCLARRQVTIQIFNSAKFAS